MHDGEKAPRSTLSSPAPPSSLSGSPSLVTPSLFSLLFHPSLLLSQVRQLRKHMMKPEDAPHPSLQSGLASCFTSPALSSFTTPSPTPSPRTTPWTRALLSLSLFLLLSLSLWWWLSSSLPLSLLLSHYFPSSVSPSSIYFHSPPSAAVFTDAASSSSSTFTIVSILDLPSSPSFLFPSSLSSSPIHLLRWHALMSWVLAVGPIHVMVYVDNERTCAWLSERPELRGLKCFLIPSIHPTYKRPLLPALFEHAHSHTGDRLIAFMARPAFLHPSVADIVGNVSHSLDRFMLVTRRTNVVLPADTLSPYTASLFTPSTSPFVVPSSSSYLPSYQQLMSPYISTLTRVFEYADHYGKLHSEYGIDLFIYPKAIFSLLQFPPYLAGVYRWDNWWLSEMILHDDVTVVDLSSTTLPLLTHDGDRTVDHPTEDGAHYNDRITKLRSGNQYKLGHANNADFRLEGRCPHCTLLKNPLQSIAVLLAKRINRSSYLAVLTFDGSMDDTVQMELLHNSMCWMQRIGFTHFITLVQDTRVAAHLTRLGIPVIHRDSSEDPSNPLTANGLPTSPDASDFAIFHVEVLRQVLKAGYHFFTGPATALLLDDPLVYLHRQLDVQLSINHTADQLTAASFWSARATTYGRDFVMKLKECVDKAKQMPKTLQTERACLADVWKLMKKNKAVKRGALDDLRFASADAALIRQLPQQQGLSLVAVDLSDQMQKRLTRGNGTRGEEKDEGKALLQLLDSWHLHLHLQPMQGDHRCLQPLYPALPPSNDGVSNPFSFSLKIKIVASFRPRSLLSLLRSLQAAVYDDDQVELEVTIDGLPAVNPTEKEKAKHAEVKKIVADFVWTQGPLVVTEERESKKGPGETGDWKGKGAFGTFLSAWTPSSSNPHQVLLLLPEYVQLSQAYYQYIKRTVSHYYLDREHYDPAMYGISLQSNMPVLATDYDVAEELPSEALLYRYQHFGSLGTVVFPQHWTAFQRWVQSKGYNTEHGMLLSLSLTDAFSNSTSTSAFSATNISNPCVPSLPSNMYWLAWNDKYNRATPTNTTLSFAIDHLYPLFFARFLHERGWYGLFPHFPDHQQLLLQSEEEKVRTVFAFSHEHDTRDKQNPDHRPRALSTLPFYSHSLPALASLALFDTAGHDVNPRLDPDDSRQDDADDRSDSRRAVGADDAADAEDVQLTLSRRGNRERSKVLAARPYQWSRSPQCSIVLRDKRREEARLQGLGLGQVVPTLPVLSNGLAAGVHAGPGRKEAGKEGAAGGEAGEKHAGGAAGAGVHPAKKVVEEDQGEEEPVDHTELLKKWKEGGRAE